MIKAISLVVNGRVKQEHTQKDVEVSECKNSISETKNSHSEIKNSHSEIKNSQSESKSFVNEPKPVDSMVPKLIPKATLLPLVSTMNNLLKLSPYISSPIQLLGLIKS